MEYNTLRKKLQLPEYGRHIQKMVDFIKEIENREERQRAAKAVIGIMGNMFPHLRDVPDFKHKLWVHLAVMANFELDIDYPYEIPSIEKIREHPKKLAYNTKPIRYMHYGRILEDMITKAATFPEGEDKEMLTQIIANHMKKTYLLWNRESVDNDVILKNLNELSRGKLTLSDTQKLNETKDILQRSKKKKITNGNNSSSNNGKSY
jgi:hypothetical protein